VRPRRVWAAVTLLAGLAADAAAVAPAPGAGPAVAAGDRASVRVERQVYLMGTTARLEAEAADRPAALRTLERLLAPLEAAEAELSTWREDSLLSTLNRQPVGEAWSAPDSLCELLAELGTWQRASGRAFDPAVGSLISAWGLDGAARLASRDELRRARRRAGLQHLRVRTSPCRITRLRDVRLDAGAFGKGAAIDRAARDAAPARWLLDLGGQVAVGGSEARPWPIALAHPARRSQPALRLSLAAGSLATSGGSERDQRIGSRTLGHILDPRSGRPVSRRGSASAWHPSALVADILSTALYVLGPEQGMEWAEARGVAACFLEPSAEGAGVAIRATRAFRERFPEAGSVTAGPEGE